MQQRQVRAADLPQHLVHGADPARVNRTLVLAVVGAMAMTSIVLASAIFLVNDPAWWMGLKAATLISALAAAASLILLVRGLKGGLPGAMMGYFLAMGARTGVSLGGGCLAVWGWGYPARPTLLLMLAFYFVMLTVEAVYLARASWSDQL